MKTLFNCSSFDATVDNDDLPEKLITYISHLLNFLSFYPKKKKNTYIHTNLWQKKIKKETVAASRTAKKEIMGFK